MIIDPALTDAIEALGVEPWEGTVWRHAFADRDPLAPSTAGGRWAPPRAFPILYTATTRDGALAEGAHLIAQYSIPPSRQRVLVRIDVRVRRAVDLTAVGALVALSIDATDFARQTAQCRMAGAAIDLLGLQAFRAPGARHPSPNLMILTDHLDQNCSIEIVETQPIE